MKQKTPRELYVRSVYTPIEHPYYKTLPLLLQLLRVHTPEATVREQAMKAIIKDIIKSKDKELQETIFKDVIAVVLTTDALKDQIPDVRSVLKVNQKPFLAHEVIGEKIGLEPKKVFFGINLIRQKMMLPKIPYPKRKLAITPDQMMAIKNLYEPLLPLPPIGCHKILAAQLKMDEWRVHVGIGLVRKQMGLERWNQEREDAPEEYRKKD